jgi:hypothetical protein
MKTGEFPAFTSNPFQFSPKQQWEEMDKTGMETGKNPSTEQCKRQESGPAGSPAEQRKFETFVEKETNRFRIQATDRSVSYGPT